MQEEKTEGSVEFDGLAIPPDVESVRRSNEAPKEETGEESLPTLAELGNALPIGYIDGEGREHSTFEIREWDWDIEDALGQLAERNPDMAMGSYISEVVAAAVRRIGDFDFDKLSPAQRRVLVQNLFYADALTLYIHVRIAAFGKVLRMAKVKLSCKHETAPAGDLMTLEVKRVDPKTMRKVVELETGIVYGGARRKRVVVNGLRWRWMEIQDAGILSNSAKMKIWISQNGIVGFEQAPGEDPIPPGPVVLSETHVRSAPPREVAKLVDEINELNGGPILEISGVCPICGKGKFRTVVDWRYENFFGSSSR